MGRRSFHLLKTLTESKAMRKTLILVLIFLAFCPFLNAQQLVQSQTYTAVTTLNNGIFEGGQGVGVHNIKWTTSGTVSTCTLTVDSAPDNATWSVGNVIPSTTCTASSGSVTVYNIAAANYVRINLSTITGGGSISITYTGYVNSAQGGPLNSLVLSTSSITPAATAATIQAVAQAFTLTGITATDTVTLLSQPTPTALCPAVFAAPQAANSVNIFFTVLTAAACTPAAGVYKFLVTR
jgi:hypothetical protein